MFLRNQHLIARVSSICKKIQLTTKLEYKSSISEVLRNQKYVTNHHKTKIVQTKQTCRQ